jgi:hypothetical protein
MAVEVRRDLPVPGLVASAGGPPNPFAAKVDGKEYAGPMAGGHHLSRTPIGLETIADYICVRSLP